LNLYCDTLIIKDSPIFNNTNQNGTIISIYARNVVTQTSQPIALTYKVTDKSRLIFYTLNLPEDFVVRFSDATGFQKDQTLKINREAGFFAVAAEYVRGNLTMQDRAIPDVEMVNMDYMNQINEDGTLREDEWLNE